MMLRKELGSLDWDDTCVVGAKAVYDESFQAGVEEAGVKMSPMEIVKRVNSRWGSRDEIIFAEIFKDRLDVSIERKRKASEAFMSIMRQKLASSVTLVPGALDTLLYLKEERGMKLGLTTACHPEILLENVMPELGIPPNLFDYTITAYDLVDVSKAKPHPYTLNKIMNELQVGPKKTFMVGDSHNDYEAAKRAGVDFIGVLTGVLNREQAQSLGIKHIVNSLVDVVPVLEAELETNGSYA